MRDDTSILVPVLDAGASVEAAAEAAPPPRSAANGRMATSLVHAMTVSAYAALGVVLGWSRLAGLGEGLCCDELATVEHFVRGGPGKILAGAYVPNNHELFSLLGWATSSAVGESEIALRLWSVIPFFVGVIVVTAWLHVRLGALSGVLFLFFVTASPLLLDLSRQARGYGLAFLAMSVLIVCALEAERSGKTWAIVGFCAAGLVGTWTLPHFGVAFVSTGAVLLTRRELRARCAAGLLVSVLAIVAWYAPHFGAIAESSRQSYGVPVDTAWLITAPIDQTLVAAMTMIDDAFFHPGLASLVLVAAFATLIGSSPLLRRRRPALVVGFGSVATVLTFWATETEVAPRFFSFLLVPLLLLTASGAASILARLTQRPPPVFRIAVAVIVLVFVVFASVPFMTEVPRLPRDPLRDVAAVISERAPGGVPVYAHIPYPLDLVFHLGRPVTWSRTTEEAAKVCDEPRGGVLVVQPWLLPSPIVPCARRAGVRHVRFEQYLHGGHTDVWIIPGTS